MRFADYCVEKVRFVIELILTTISFMRAKDMSKPEFHSEYLSLIINDDIININ